MTEPTEAATTQRGRPRPNATIDRDERVRKHLEAEGPRSRAALATELDMPGNQVYLSLWRLSHSDPPKIVKQGARWAVPDAPEAPAAAAPVE